MAISGVNFFDHSANQNYDFSALQVYVNDELTNIPANAITAETGDDIKIVSLSDSYPFFYPSEKAYIASIEEPLPFMGETDFSSYFYGCFSLVSIPEGLFDNNPNITDFSYCFDNCLNLTSIPSGLFDNNTKVTSFRSCFGSCYALTSIPLGLFNSNLNVNDFRYCFYSCEKLTVNVQIGSTANSVDVEAFNEATAAKGTVYCRAGSATYNAFLEYSEGFYLNVLTY